MIQNGRFPTDEVPPGHRHSRQGMVGNGRRQRYVGSPRAGTLADCQDLVRRRAVPTTACGADRLAGMDAMAPAVGSSNGTKKPSALCSTSRSDSDILACADPVAYARLRRNRWRAPLMFTRQSSIWRLTPYIACADSYPIPELTMRHAASFGTSR